MASKQPAEVKSLFAFFKLCGNLKHLKRTGWVLRGVKEPESVASHTYRMAMMAFMFGGNGVDPSVNRERCIKMALVHDLAESLVGDLLPNEVTKDEKYRREKAAMDHIKTLVPEKVGTELYQLWQEYDSGSSAEAMVVKDLDKFDMILQAYEYEQEECRTGALQEFFDSTDGKFNTAEVKGWVDELKTERSKNQHSKNVTNQS